MKVSIITPYTPDRFHFMERIRAIVASQTYPVHEHIFDISDTVLGTKRNNMVKSATGDIIAHFDIDDIYTPDYLEVAVNQLIRSNSDLIGINKCHFHNVQPDTFHLWQSDTNKQVFITEATWVYYKEKFTGFQAVKEGEGRLYLANARYSYYSADTFLATIHGSNTCCHKALPHMKKEPTNEALSLRLKYYGY